MASDVWRTKEKENHQYVTTQVETCFPIPLLLLDSVWLFAPFVVRGMCVCMQVVLLGYTHSLGMLIINV